MANVASRAGSVSSVVKVPAITVLFWAIKVLTTGMGEAASDYLGEKNLLLAGVIGLGGGIVALVLQLRSKAFVPWRYWTAVAMVAVFGTMAADVVRVVLGVPYLLTTLLYAGFVAVCFTVWYRSEGTLSIHTIDTPRREYFYWTTVLGSFALGTAAGDFTANQLHLGYLASALLFAALILVPLVGWRRFGLGEIPAFWMAYVLTRPLGASIADWLGKPADRAGLGLGDGPVTLVCLVVFVGLVLYATRPVRSAPLQLPL